MVLTRGAVGGRQKGRNTNNESKINIEFELIAGRVPEWSRVIIVSRYIDRGVLYS